MKKLLTTITLSAACVVSTSSIAGAQGYGSSDGAKSTTTAVVAPKLEDVNSTVAPVALQGRTIRLSIGGFGPNAFVEVFILSEPVYLGRFQSDSNGVVSIEATIPESVPAGDHNVIASGTDPSGKPFSVAAAVALGPAPSGLALTGQNASSLAALAGLLIVVGCVGTVAARRRMTVAESPRASVGGH